MTQLAIVDNGKQPDENWHVTMFINLPSDTPFGNMTLKYMKIVGRIDEVNRKILETNEYWNSIIQQKMINSSLLDRQVYAIEAMVYHMRRAIDELISMIYFLQIWEETGSYPQKIVVDSIGSLLSEKPAQLIALFLPDIVFLEELNSISNAYKHSFVNSDLTRIGAEEPCVHALALKNNKLESDVIWHNVRCREVIAKFDCMFNRAKGWLKTFYLRHK